MHIGMTLRILMKEKHEAQALNASEIQMYIIAIQLLWLCLGVAREKSVHVISREMFFLYTRVHCHTGQRTNASDIS